jgi:hypothetical protein
MRDLALLLIGAATTYVGFAWLAMSQDRHWRSVGGIDRVPPRRRLWLRRAAAVPLCLSLAISLFRDGSGFGMLMWLGELCLAAYAVVVTLSRWPRLLGRLPLAPRSCWRASSTNNSRAA